MPIAINGTTGISGVDGSATAPALQGSDSNTGLSFASDTVNINTGGITRATVDSAGRIGIGVSDVSDYWEGGDQLVIKDTGTGGCGITIHADTDDESGIFFADGTTGNAKYEGYIQYDHATNEMQLATSAVKRMRIDSSGKVLINTASTGNVDNGSTNASYENAGSRSSSRDSTNTRGHLVFYNPNGQVGGINTSGSATSFNTSSDYRLKENVTAISDGITRLKTLKPSRFNFKVDKDTTVDGFLAHEVTAVPEAITGTKDEVDSDNKPVYQGIDQSKLVPLLTAALQEAVAKIEVLETKVAALEAA